MAQQTTLSPTGTPGAVYSFTAKAAVPTNITRLVVTQGNSITISVGQKAMESIPVTTATTKTITVEA